MKVGMELCLKFLGSLLLLIIFTVLVGCANKFTINYRFDTPPQSGVTTHSIAIAIAPFLDERPQIERTRSGVVGVTGDRDLTGPVPQQIASVIARHFEQDKLFLRQEAVDGKFMKPTPDQLTLLKSMGYDAVLIGSISHFFGLLGDMKNQRLIVGLAGLFPVLLVPAVAAKKPYIGYTELSNLKILDTNSGRVIWEGRVEGKELRETGGFETFGKIYGVAFESLKISVADLVKELTMASL